MYHFIRRFFLFVLVFACCFSFTRTGHTQGPTGIVDPGFSTGLTLGWAPPAPYIPTDGGSMPSISLLTSDMGYGGIALQSFLNIGQQSFGRSLQPSVVIPTQDLTITQTMEPPLIGGWHSPVAGSARIGIANYTSNQQYIPNSVTQSKVPGVGSDENGAYSFISNALQRAWSVTSVYSLPAAIDTQSIPMAVWAYMEAIRPREYYPISFGFYGNLYGYGGYSGALYGQ